MTGKKNRPPYLRVIKENPPAVRPRVQGRVGVAGSISAVAVALEEMQAWINRTRAKYQGTSALSVNSINACFGAAEMMITNFGKDCAHGRLSLDKAISFVKRIHAQLAAVVDKRPIGYWFDEESNRFEAAVEKFKRAVRENFGVDLAVSAYLNRPLRPRRPRTHLTLVR